MQLVSLQSLLVLTLPALSASLPQGQVSNAAPAGHLLHRRINNGSPLELLEQVMSEAYGYPEMYFSNKEYDAPANNQDISDPNTKLRNGVFRHPNEERFYEQLLDIIKKSKDQWRSEEHRIALMQLCATALAKVKEEKSGPMEYDIMFAKHLTATILLDIKDEKLREEIVGFARDTIGIFNETGFPRDVAEAIAEKTPSTVSGDFPEQKQALYYFLRYHVFGYAIESTERADEIIMSLISGSSSDRAGLVIQLVDELASDYHTYHIKRAIQQS